jgi:hypothetical protein
MTDMHMQRGDGEIVMMMLGGHQPARQFAFLMFIHVRQDGIPAPIPATEDPG